MQKFLLVLLLSLPFGVVAQPNLPDDVADSMWGVWKNTKLPDTTRLKALDDYAWNGYLYTQPDSAFYYAQLEIDFINKKLKKSRNKNHLLKIKSSALNTQGSSFYIQGNVARAIDYYTRCLEIKEQIDDKPGMASTLNNIGLIYSDQGNFERALVYLKRCLEIEKSLGDTLDVGTTLGNLGSVYQGMEKDDVALKHYQEALPILEKYNEERAIASALSNMGKVFLSRGDVTRALEYQERSLRLREKIGDQRAVSSSLASLANIYRKQKKYPKALEFGQKSLDLSQKIGAATQSKTAAESLWETYKAMGQYRKSLEMHELYIKLRDSVDSEENRQEVIRQEYEYEYNKQAALDSATFAQKEALSDAKLARKNAESDKKDAELAAKRNQQYALFGGLALLVIFAGFMYNRFRVTRHQKDIIEEQKGEVELQKGKIEEAHREITDSIHYAKRIQTAILPPDKLIKQHLPESFVLYKPKDVVAGDFYWLEAATDPQNNATTILFAAADCTGHGVPGAMVSVVCNNGLNRSVREHQLVTPGSILDKTREIVIQEFEKSEEDVKDGMDIALCTLQGSTLRYAGANNPLWIIRKGGTEVEETRADKQPIGKFENAFDYTNHEFQLQSGDTIYVFSDGFADQFGGEKGKKFKAVQLKQLLLSMQDKTMEQQGRLLDKAFENWKGDLEQLDDVCVIGVRIS